MNKMATNRMAVVAASCLAAILFLAGCPWITGSKTTNNDLGAPAGTCDSCVTNCIGHGGNEADCTTSCSGNCTH